MSATTTTTDDNWSYWPRHRDKILARFCESDLYPLIEVYAREPPADPHYSYSRGAWSLAGDPMPYFPWDHRAFTKAQARGTLILLDCLPAPIYDQVAACDTVCEKWKRLHQLYEIYRETTCADGAASPVVPDIGIDESAVHPKPTDTDTNDDTPRIKPRNRVSEQANDFILDKLRHYPAYGSDVQPTSTTHPNTTSTTHPNMYTTSTTHPNTKYTYPSILEHITYMHILYEGLVQRNAPISEAEFIGLIHATLQHLPAFQAFVTALNAQAKNQGLKNVSIHALIEGIAEFETSLGNEELSLSVWKEKLLLGKEKLLLGKEKLSVGKEKLALGKEKSSSGKEKSSSGKEKLSLGPREHADDEVLADTPVNVSFTSNS